MVIIFSTKFDYSTTCVIKWLDYYHIKTIRLNTDEDTYTFVGLSKNTIYLKNTRTDEMIDLKEGLRACWWRRSGIIKKHLCDFFRENWVIDNMDLTSIINGSRSYIEDEAKALLDYLFYDLYQSSPLNLGTPEKFDTNRLKVMAVAQKYGLNTPGYEIITNGSQLLKSNKILGKIVTKAISNGIYADVGNHRFYTYTELADAPFYKENEKNVFFPSLITELIEKNIEIRSFFIVDRFYSMAIFSQSDEQTKIDFRKYTDNRREPYQLPKDIEIKLSCVFKELGLNCGSADLIVNSKGEYVFLEINPVGQFDMTGRPCNYNLHKIVANYLIHGT